MRGNNALWTLSAVFNNRPEKATYNKANLLIQELKMNLRHAYCVLDCCETQWINCSAANRKTVR